MTGRKRQYPPEHEVTIYTEKVTLNTRSGVFPHNANWIFAAKTRSWLTMSAGISSLTRF